MLVESSTPGRMPSVPRSGQASFGTVNRADTLVADGRTRYQAWEKLLLLACAGPPRVAAGGRGAAGTAEAAAAQASSRGTGAARAARRRAVRAAVSLFRDRRAPGQAGGCGTVPVCA